MLHEKIDMQEKESNTGWVTDTVILVLDIPVCFGNRFKILIVL
jgi:hypothetical protein